MLFFINNVSVYRGTFPSKFGGRLSSIIDITQKEGDNKKTKTSFGIGLTDASLTIEGPIQKDKLSFIVTGRKTLVDPLLLLASSLSQGQDYKMIYGFHDIKSDIGLFAKYGMRSVQSFLSFPFFSRKSILFLQNP
jgi:hypothetical protein